MKDGEKAHDKRQKRAVERTKIMLKNLTRQKVFNWLLSLQRSPKKAAENRQKWGQKSQIMYQLCTI